VNHFELNFAESGASCDPHCKFYLQQLSGIGSFSSVIVLIVFNLTTSSRFTKNHVWGCYDFVYQYTCNYV